MQRKYQVTKILPQKGITIFSLKKVGTEQVKENWEPFYIFWFFYKNMDLQPYIQNNLLSL